MSELNSLEQRYCVAFPGKILLFYWETPTALTWELHFLGRLQHFSLKNVHTLQS